MALEIVKSEDFIEYFIFPDIKEKNEGVLNELKLKIVEIAKSYEGKYIWHKDSFVIQNQKFSSILSDTENNGELK